MSLSDTIKNTLAVFRETKEPITPDNYSRVFCAEAKKLGLDLPDCNFIKRSIANLAPQTQAEAEAYRIRTKEELVVFLTSRLNRAITASRADAFNLTSSIVRSLLNVIESLKIDNLSAEAAFSLERDISHPLILQDEKKRWSRIEKRFGSVDDGAKATLSRAAGLFAIALKKAAIGAISEEAKTAIAELRKNPSNLTAPAFLSRVEELLLRSNADRVFSERIKELETMLKEFRDNLSAQSVQSGELEEAIAQSGESDGSWRLFKASLTAFGESLKERSKTMGALQNKIAVLEERLAKSQAEALSDAATKAPNRRAVNARLDESESSFAENGVDYAAGFLEIDGFDNLLSALGVSSSETILAIAADFLARTLPQNAFFGHYMGHTFLALISQPSKAKLEADLGAIVSKMASKRFMYEGRSFAVTISVGAALRSKSKSAADCLSAADAALRLARLSGGGVFKADL
ncbi:MAG: GGDEF domain-containing protein [Helicobacteraceae bacterium]|jgi:diguanylate cyclase (GGDEF)-like protein|nr:GGDEF domain-containing protein [Helicobacteraceae bacterium]